MKKSLAEDTYSAQRRFQYDIFNEAEMPHPKLVLIFKEMTDSRPGGCCFVSSLPGSSSNPSLLTTRVYISCTSPPRLQSRCLYFFFRFFLNSPASASSLLTRPAIAEERMSSIRLRRVEAVGLSRFQESSLQRTNSPTEVSSSNGRADEARLSDGLTSTRTC